jgi:hypothetical protein
MRILHYKYGFWLLALVMVACTPSGETGIESPLFRSLPSSRTGIDFSNQLEETVELNILNYLYFFNGGGVAVGDLNQDGLPDLYFTANQQPNKLYINRGNFQFEEVTGEAGVAGFTGWATGVTIADVNGDGLPDLYVCQVSGYHGLGGHNQLYINQGNNSRGIPVFQEEARAYGLAFEGFSTQAAFFDYDRDGDLDLYLLNHAVHTTLSYGKAAALRPIASAQAGDRLFRQEQREGKPYFVDVTAASGIYSSQIGYGLGIAISDINQDGWPDLYIGNDFHENDYLYLNNQDGTFTEILTQAIGHTSRFTMGVDIADFNNDGLPDILSLDMKPEREDILKTAAPEDTPEIFDFKLQYGYAPQYARNHLQLQVDHAGKTPAFSEIAQLAGVDATDWSWAGLFADFDNDGWKDIFISNGIYRRPNDMDYLKFISEGNIKRSLDKGVDAENLRVILEMPQIPISNYLFRNQQDLTFKSKAKEWGLGQEGFSNGAVYADLDGDGDLDLVVNNINAPALVYENLARQQPNPANYLQVTLEGPAGNRFGIGATLRVWVGETIQYTELFTTRGFQSAVDPLLHTGLGQAAQIDSICLTWPDGRQTRRYKLSANQRLALRHAEATPAVKPPSAIGQTFFTESNEWLPPYRHQENNFNDFSRERLIPHQLSKEGPALAVGDVNHDGLEDCYIGGGAGSPGALYLQQPDGSLKAVQVPLWEAERIYEDVCAVFFDADQDGDLDLLVGSGGNEFDLPGKLLEDRLYLNDGTGHFTKSSKQLPPSFFNTSCIVPFDADGDGDLDLFVGTRVLAGKYGIPASSFLFINENGTFTDQSERLAPGFRNLGMVTAAVATAAVAAPGKEATLWVTGEWMPIRKFAWNGSKLEEVPLTFLHQGKPVPAVGWWNTLATGDFNQDGQPDLVAGNLGLNSYLQASSTEPLGMLVGDFDKNGSLDQLISRYKTGKDGKSRPYPLVDKDGLTEQINAMRKRYPRFQDYATIHMGNLFNKQERQGALQWEADWLASAILIAAGTDTFALHALPMEAQFAPVKAMVLEDLNHDGLPDLVLGGNFKATGPMRGQYTALKGLVLLNQGDARFQPLTPRESGLFLSGEVRNMRWLKGSKTFLLVARNNQEALRFLWKYKNNTKGINPL